MKLGPARPKGIHSKAFSSMWYPLLPVSASFSAYLICLWNSFVLDQNNSWKWKELIQIKYFLKNLFVFSTYFFQTVKKFEYVYFISSSIHNFLNLRQWTNKLAKKRACSWIKSRNAKDSLKYSLKLPPSYIFSPHFSKPNQDLLIFKTPGSKPRVKTDVIYVTEII